MRIFRKRYLLTLVSLIVLVAGAIWIKNYVEEQYLYPIRYQEAVEKYSQEYSVDEALVYAVINCESGFDPEAVSAAGAMGLMQITPETFAWLQTKDETADTLSDDMLYDPETNIKYGILLLSLNLEEFGDVKTVLASYNAGRGKVSEWLADERYSTSSGTLAVIPYAETEKYVEKVSRNYEVYKERLGGR